MSSGSEGTVRAGDEPSFGSLHSLWVVNNSEVDRLPKEVVVCRSEPWSTNIKRERRSLGAAASTVRQPRRVEMRVPTVAAARRASMALW